MIEQTAQAWAQEDAEAYRRASDENAARLCPLWVAVAESKAVSAWQPGDLITRERYDAGIRKAKEAR